MALVVSNEGISQQEECICVVKDTVNTEKQRYILKLPTSATQEKLYSDVCRLSEYVSGTFDLILVQNDEKESKEISIDETADTLTIMDVNLKLDQKNHLQIRERKGEAIELVRPTCKPEDLDSTIPPPPPTITPTSKPYQRRMAVSGIDEESIKKKSEEILKRSNSPVTNDEGDVIPASSLRYVGLVNQAMTCYLNSLIQTLFMTPEFRNALYKWVYNMNDNHITNIPYQLQRLFLLLQTTSKQSVETTGLTQSFGWDSSEAWQQHDIQELCRVMFDALEKKFEGTDQADLIKRLYEGKMRDYVQCCECSHESARDDTFMDIPITIRPFGSTTSYKSVMEGLYAFVEPETLDEGNQYYCEKCAKKCDAKKGLKFIQFPYLLTLQLKRFDFDYSTMHRIKLNDRMWFPQILNLNPFIEDGQSSEPVSEDDGLNDQEEIDQTDKIAPQDEDSSSHDSGHDLDQQSSKGTTPSSGTGSGDGNHGDPRMSSEEEASSVDEGIDIESQKSSSSSRRKHRNSSTWWMNDEDQIKDFIKDGPFVYELFSVMVHSGSAAGGHYYAYIKSFENGRWYSFNDQIVSPVTHTEIEKTFGGSPYPSSSSYYSSFSSSTNAYMLMYRQIDSTKNANFTSTEGLPDHIHLLMKKQEQEERNRKMRLEQERNMCSIKLFCRHPTLFRCQVQSLVEESFDFHKDITLEEALKQAHLLLKLDPNVVPLDRCRLVKYDHINDVLDRSFDIISEEDSKCSFSQLLGGVRSAYLFDLLLETREVGEKFEKYEAGGVTVKVYVANPENMSFYDPVIVRAAERHTVLQLRSSIAQRIRCSPYRLLIALEKYSGECHLMQSINRTLKQEGFYRSAKVFVDILSEEDAQLVNESHPIYLEDTQLFKIIDRIANIITINIALPSTETREDSESEEGKTFEDNTPPDQKSSPDGITASGSSSDEGVGSLGGSSNNGVNPPNQEGPPPDSSPRLSSPFQHPDEKDEDQSTKSKERDLTPSEIKGFWQTPELTTQEEEEDFPDDVTRERRRNNSYDNGVGFSQFSADFQGKLQERLEGYAMAGSPTSSLRCEDGSDLDFDDDLSRDNDDNQALQPSEGSSLSTSCSTLDSTDTLCNTSDQLITEPTSVTTFTNKAFIYSSDEMRFQKNNDDNSVPVPIKRYPGRAVPCTRTTSHYNKALLYAEDGAVESLSGTPGDGDDARGTGDASSNTKAAVQGCIKNPIVTSEPTKSVAWVDETEAGKPLQCNNSCTPSCGGVYNDNLYDYSNKEPESFSFSTSPRDSPVESKAESDPDSGEAMDVIGPLFENVSSDNPSSSAPTKSQTFDEVWSPSLVRNNRERTISTSSDGWGMSGEYPSHKSYYFKVVGASQAQVAKSVDSPDSVSCKVITVEIDKRMNLMALKRHLVHIVDAPTRRFCFYKQYANGQEVEMFTLTDDFKLVTDGTHFIVRFGRALCKDEYRCKLYQLQLSQEETAKFLMNWIIQRNVTVEDARKQLCNDLAEQCDIQVEPERLRIRKKSWRSPGQILLPEEKFGVDISLYGSLEFFVEFLNEPELKMQRSQLALFCRRWRPSELRFDDFHEVILNEDTSQNYLGYSADDVRDKLSEHSGIEKENLQVAKGRGMFPYRISVLDADKELEWIPSDKKSYNYPLHITDDGTVIFYKDRSEELKECSDEEKEKIKNEEMKSDSSISISKRTSSVTSSPSRPVSYRRERALKIYTVDTTPTPKNNRDVTTEL